MARKTTAPAQAPPKKGLTEEAFWGIALLVPYFAVFALFVVFPVLYGIWLGSRPAAYRKLFQDPVFVSTLANTVIFLVVAVNVKMMIALGLSAFFLQERAWIRWLSVLFLIAGVGALAWYTAATHGNEHDPAPPASDPLAGLAITPSMRATAKYFWLVIALFLVQIGLGAVTAHYQVEGQQFYGAMLADVLPYSLTRTWHTQLAVLWIATAWLGTGLFIAPAISMRLRRRPSTPARWFRR